MEDEQDNKAERTEGFRNSLFWGCGAVFVALLITSGLQCWTTVQQRSLLRQAKENANSLVAQARLVEQQLEPRLEAFSMDLIDIARTNDVARQVVRQFNIKYQGGQTDSGKDASQ